MVISRRHWIGGKKGGKVCLLQGICHADPVLARSAGGYTKITKIPAKQLPPPTITMTDNSESELEIARAKHPKTFRDWEKLALDCELVYGGRTFIKGHVNVVAGTMLTDEDRLIQRINQNYASSQKQYSTKREKGRKEKDELIRRALSPALQQNRNQPF